MKSSSYVIYVVDDDADICMAIERLLRSAGYRTVTFESAEDFLDCISENEEGCLVLDIALPGMTGFELQEKLSSLGSNYPIVFITAQDNPLWENRAKEVGAVAFLKKPFPEQKLFEAIELCRVEEV